MKNATLIATPALLLAFAATTVQAQDATAVDADGDGQYTYEEVIAVYPDVTEETYMTMDANGDGTVDAEEWATAEADGMLPSEEDAG